MTGVRSIPLILALFLVQLANRESALFIALWLVIDSVTIGGPGHSLSASTIDAARAGIGVAAGVLAVVWTTFIRHRLLIHETGILPMGIHVYAGQWWALPHIGQFLRYASTLTDVTMLLFLVTLAWITLRGCRSLGSRAWKVCLLIGAIATANFLFAVIIELRVWLTLIPFLPWMVYIAEDQCDPRLLKPDWPERLADECATSP